LTSRKDENPVAEQEVHFFDFAFVYENTGGQVPTGAPLLPWFVSGIDANPVSVYYQEGRGLVTFGACLASLQNMENEANLLLPLGIQKLKGFQLRGFGP